MDDSAQYDMETTHVKTDNYAKTDMNKHRYGHKSSHMQRYTNTKHTHTHAHRQTDRDRQAYTDIQIDTHTHTHTVIQTDTHKLNLRSLSNSLGTDQWYFWHFILSAI